VKRWPGRTDYALGSMQAATAPAPASEAAKIAAMTTFSMAFLLAPICGAGARAGKSTRAAHGLLLRAAS
jgi:hypothetical protein